MPEISVIVLNWNGKHFLELCLGSLRKQTYRDFEVILVDNGSEDGSAEYVRTHFPEVHLIALSQNLGFCGGNNAGYEHTKGDIVVLLNNDTEVHPDWLLELHNAAARYPNAGSFASKMLYFDERDRLDNCGFGLTNAGLTVDHGRSDIDGIAWAEPRSVFGACAGAGAYRRSMIEKIGFLDNDFFTFYEDVDLAFRAQLRGYDCVFIPGAIVYHRYRATMNKYRSRQIFLTQRNVEFVYLKNLPFGLMVRSLPQRVLYELGGFLYFAKMGVGTAFLRGKADALRNLPKVIRKRRIIQKQKTVTTEQLLSRMQGSWFALKWKKLASAWRRVPQETLSPSQP